MGFAPERLTIPAAGFPLLPDQVARLLCRFARPRQSPREVVPGTSALPFEVGVSEFAQQLLQLAAVNVPFHRLGRRLRRWQGVLLGGSSSAS